MELEQKRMSISLEEKITVGKLQVEKKKVEAEGKIAAMKEKDKLTVKLPKLDSKKFDENILKWTEFWDTFEATIHNKKGLHAVENSTISRVNFMELPAKLFLDLNLPKTIIMLLLIY